MFYIYETHTLEPWEYESIRDYVPFYPESKAKQQSVVDDERCINAIDSYINEWFTYVWDSGDVLTERQLEMWLANDMEDYLDDLGFLN